MQPSEKEECARKELPFEPCRVIEQPILWSGLAARMIRKMGMDKFIFDTQVPALEEELCCEFIRSFHQGIDGGVGCVRGQRIILCAESLRNITGLPVGESRANPPAEEYIKALISLFPRKRKSEHGYYMPDIVVENRDEFIAIAVMLMQKLMCSSRSGKYASPSIFLAMFFSITKRVSYPWAWLMCEQMQEAILMSKKESRAFPYGEWLSGLIRHQMQREAENQQRKALRAAKTGQEDKLRRKAVKRKYQGAVEPVAPRFRTEQAVEKVEGSGREETMESAKPEKGRNSEEPEAELKVESGKLGNGSGAELGFTFGPQHGIEDTEKIEEHEVTNGSVGMTLGAQNGIEETAKNEETAAEAESAKLENESGPEPGLALGAEQEAEKNKEHEAAINSKNVGDDTAKLINSKNAGDDTSQQERRLKLLQLQKEVASARSRNATRKLEWEAKIADVQKLKHELEDEHKLHQQVQAKMEELQDLEENNRLTRKMLRAFEAGKDNPIQSLKRHLELYTKYKRAIAMLKLKLIQGPLTVDIASRLLHNSGWDLCYTFFMMVIRYGHALDLDQARFFALG